MVERRKTSGWYVAPSCAKVIHGVSWIDGSGGLAIITPASNIIGIPTRAFPPRVSARGCRLVVYYGQETDYTLAAAHPFLAEDVWLLYAPVKPQVERPFRPAVVGKVA